MRTLWLFNPSKVEPVARPRDVAVAQVPTHSGDECPRPPGSAASPELATSTVETTAPSSPVAMSERARHFLGMVIRWDLQKTTENRRVPGHEVWWPERSTPP